MRPYLILFFALSLAVIPASAARASLSDDIALKMQQIQQLQQQIDQYQQQIDATHSKSVTLENQVKSLNARIGQLSLELKSLGVSIDETGLEIQDTEGKIADTEDKLSKHRQALGQYLRIAYELDQTSLTEILLNNATLSDFFNDVHNLQTTEDDIKTTMNSMQTLKQDLDLQHDNLIDKKTDLEKLKSLQEVQKRSLDGEKSTKNKLLADTKGQESKFQDMVKKSKLDIARIQDQIYYLQKNGVSAEDAVKYGEMAAIAVGIRPAFLLGILEIESGLGRNVGTGNWMDDMYNCYLRLGKPSRAETEKAAFMTIVSQLGLDPATVKVSREPNYGCGGALGPAQFIPSTWLAYADRVADLTGHRPANPWTIEDAFMASAIKLSNAGATSKTRAGESAAARAYISGKSTCTSAICNSYSNAVLRKADEIEKNL